MRPCVLQYFGFVLPFGICTYCLQSTVKQKALMGESPPPWVNVHWFGSAHLPSLTLLELRWSGATTAHAFVKKQQQTKVSCQQWQKLEDALAPFKFPVWDHFCFAVEYNDEWEKNIVLFLEKTVVRTVPWDTCTVAPLVWLYFSTLSISLLICPSVSVASGWCFGPLRHDGNGKLT